MTDQPYYGPVPTTAPGARTLADTALARLRDASAQAVASDVLLGEHVLAVVNSVRGVALSGPVERVLADVIRQLLERPELGNALASGRLLDEPVRLEVRRGVDNGNPHHRPTVVEVIR